MPLPKGYQLSNFGNSSLNANYSHPQLPSKEDIEMDKANYQAEEQLFSEWDWQNEQQLGPKGEALPKYAIGW